MRIPFFSIIIPTYNSSETISGTLSSIVSQTFNDYEVIIMDGLSKDNTKETVQKFIAKHPQIKFYSEKDNGIYDAMNKGIKKATGQWIYFVGSDDTLYDKAVLQQVYNHISKNKNYKLIYGNVRIIGSVNWAKDGQVYDGKFTFEKLMQKNISHQACFYHHTLFQIFGEFNVKYNICADYDFNLRIFAKIKTLYVPIIIANFYTGGASSVDNDDSFSKDKWRLIIKYTNIKLLLYNTKQYSNKIREQSAFLKENKKYYLYFISLLCFIKNKFLK
tara:strand:- start:44509 stop:45330 length:822 start_codon:yes stop_codon:yes gene_type:complete